MLSRMKMRGMARDTARQRIPHHLDVSDCSFADGQGVLGLGCGDKRFVFPPMNSVQRQLSGNAAVVYAFRGVPFAFSGVSMRCSTF